MSAAQQPPLALIRWLLGLPFTQAIYVAAKLGIPDLLKDETRSCAQLSQAAHVNAGALRRLLRMLVNTGLIKKADEDSYALTPAGHFLRSDTPGSLKHLAELGGEPWHLHPWTDLIHSIRTGEPAFDRLHGIGFYDYLARHPDSALLFDQAMDAVVGRFASAVAASLHAKEGSVIVDVGGGRGKLLGTVLQRNPRLRGMIFDMKQAVAAAQATMYELGVAERCTLHAGDFFASVPPGGDIYILSHVLHNWDDARAIRILRNCREAMSSAARLWIVEIVMGAAPDFYSVWLDLEMLVNFGGRERSESEYEELVREAGLILLESRPAEAPVCILECACA
jgi:hypothetical protein